MEHNNNLLVEQGNQLLLDKKLDEALNCFIQSVQVDKNNWKAYWGIAQIAKEVQDFTLVEKACKLVQQLNPDFANYARDYSTKYAIGYYSQYGQDVFVEKFFKYVLPRKKIFIDVGAFDGYHLSNIRRLYETYGWTGLCIEPVTKNFLKLSNLYKNTPVTCIQTAISHYEGVVEMNVSTATTDPDEGSAVASLNAEEMDRWKDYSFLWNKESVTVKKLTTVLQEQQIDDFDFISIDTEGEDLNVLKGLDFNIYQPQLIIIEYGKFKKEIEEYLAQYKYVKVFDNNLDLFLVKNNPEVISLFLRNI